HQHILASLKSQHGVRSVMDIWRAYVDDIDSRVCYKFLVRPMCVRNAAWEHTQQAQCLRTVGLKACVPAVLSFSPEFLGKLLSGGHRTRRDRLHLDVLARQNRCDLNTNNHEILSATRAGSR